MAVQYIGHNTSFDAKKSLSANKRIEKSFSANHDQIYTTQNITLCHYSPKAGILYPIQQMHLHQCNQSPCKVKFFLAILANVSYTLVSLQTCFYLRMLNMEIKEGQKVITLYRLVCMTFAVCQLVC